MRTRRIKQEQYFPMMMFGLIAIWLISLLMYSGQYSWRQVTSEMLATWAVIVLSINFILATRHPMVEAFFGGLDKVYAVHRHAAYFALGFLVLHFIMIPDSGVMTAGKPLGILSLVFILLGVIVSVAPAFKRMIPYHKWINMHKAMALFFLLGIVHSLLVPTLTMQLPLVALVTYGFALAGIAAFIYREAVYNRQQPKLDYEVTEVKSFDNDVTEITLSPKNAALEHKAGQFTFLSLAKHNKGEQHPYTISNHPDTGQLRFSIKALGDYTAQLQNNITVGDQASVQGSHGGFTLEAATQTKQVWLAGGIGITPFLSMLGALESQHEITLVWSVNAVADANYRAEIEAAAKASKGKVTFQLWNSDEKGYFAIDRLFKTSHLTNTAIYICGPEKMREGYIDQLMEKGVSIGDIHYEEFGFR